jgi:hypothetical protein
MEDLSETSAAVTMPVKWGILEKCGTRSQNKHTVNDSYDVHKLF